MVKIRYSDEFVCPKCGNHTALVCHTDGTYQARCMICNVFYDVEIAPITNYDRLRAKSVEEMAEFMANNVGCDDCRFFATCRSAPQDRACADKWLDWLKQEAEE